MPAPVYRKNRKDIEKKVLLTWDLLQWVKVRSKALKLSENAFVRDVLSADMEYCSSMPEGIEAPIKRASPSDRPGLSDRTIDNPSIDKRQSHD